MRADRRRWRALYVLCAGGLVVIVDETVVNVALPVIQRDLGFSSANLAWVVNAYLIAFGGLLLLGGRLGDLIGRRRVFVSGLVVFTLASLLCALAQSEATLIGARFLQGVGGALASSVVLGMIVTMFPDQREQAKAIGVYGFSTAAGASVGLLAGGALTEAVGWHWIFLVNVPIGVAGVVATLRNVEERPGLGLERGADLPGAALLTGGLMLGVFVIVKVEQWGWGAAATLAWGGLSVALLAAFVVRQERVANPLMPLRLFRSRNMNGASLALMLAIVGMFAMFFLGAISMQKLLGYGPLEVGLAFLPNTVVIAVVSLYVVGPASLRFGARPVVVVGLVAMAVSLVLFAHTPVDGSLVADLMPPIALMGVGEGLVLPVLMRVAMAEAPAGDAGLASGLVGTLQQVGAAVGLAAMATLAADRTQALQARGEPFAAALAGGYHRAYLVSAGLAVVAIVVVVAVLRPQPAGAAADGHAAESAACSALAEEVG